MTAIKKIAIIRLSSIGDIVLTTPLIRAVRKTYPEAVIDFIVKEQFVDLVKTNPHLTNVLTFNHTAGWKELRSLKKLIRKENYDLLVDLHKNPRSVYLRTGSRASTIVKHKKDYWKRTLLIWFGINRFKTGLPIYLRYFRALEPFDISPDRDGAEIHVPQQTAEKIHARFMRDGLRADRPVLILCPGAGYSTKRWTPEGFAEAGDHFCKKYSAGVVILGGESDRAVCSRVQGLMMNRSVNYAASFTLLETAAALKLGSVVITNDTGLLHMAQAINKPVVALFGSTSRELGYFPFPEKSFVIEKDISCRPCTHNGRNNCPKKHFKCMNEITPEEVIQAAEQLYQSETQHTGNGIGKTLVSSL